MAALVTRILCPIDLSDHSQHALDYAAGLARHYGASLTALYVIPPPIPPTGLDSPAYAAYVYTQADLDAIGRQVRSFVDGCDADGSISTRVVEGYVVGEILSTAVALSADLIVIGTHGRGGVQRLFLGSVAERVLARASCPVMATPPRMADTAPFGPSLFSNVLCAVDYTPPSLRALEYAANFASEARAQLTLLHVVEVPVKEPAVVGVRAVLDENLLVTAARGRLQSVVPAQIAMGKADVVARTGKAYRAILDVAQQQHSDLIVLGAHGGLANALGIGSTTNHVLREASCPVLCVRA